MKKQRIGAVVLAGVMLLGLAGCGNQKVEAFKKYVTLGQYTGIEYTKTVEEVTDEDVQYRLDSFVEQHKEKEEVKDRAVEDGDIVNIDFVGTMNGEEFEGGTSQGYDLTIGSHSFIDGFEDGLVGHELGEEVSLDLKFPDPYENDPDKAGKDVNFKVTINTISVEKTPELTDALVKDNTDYKTVEEYKKSIREEMEKSNEETAEQQAKTDVFNKVVENCTITGYDEEEAKKLVDDEFERFKQMADSYAAYGYSYEQVLSLNGYDTEDALKEGITEYIKNYLEQKMVLYCIADKENLKVSDEEIEEKVKEYMDNNSITDRAEVDEQLGEDYFETYLLSEKVIDFLMEHAVQVESTEEKTEDSDDQKDTEAETEAETEAVEETEEVTEAKESEAEETEAEAESEETDAESESEETEAEDKSDEVAAEGESADTGAEASENEETAE